MAKYKCKICGYIFDEEKEGKKFNELTNDWTCPLCHVGLDLFEEVLEEKNSDNRVAISEDNLAIRRILEKCVNCGMCKQACINKENMDFKENSDLCVNCGQCIHVCPVDALKPKSDYDSFEKAKADKKICIAYTSPSVRVALGEAFNLESGAFLQKKLIGLLRMLGFDYVFDTTFAADLTIMEEASELVDRIKNNKTLPMFTSCCPAWVKYAEQFHPTILKNISTCKSPIGMMGMVVKKYFGKNNQLREEDLYTVAITPCTAKKYEVKREEIKGTDLVITISEIIDKIKEKNIKYEDILESDYDNFFREGSGAGVIFGNTGGVMEAALRTGYYFLTNKELESVNFMNVRGYNNVREASVKINDIELQVAVVDGMSNAKEILDEVEKGISKYHYIEIMNCEGGCIGGGGQPKVTKEQQEEVKKKRIESLYNRDNNLEIRCSHHNPQIIEIYKSFLHNPLSDESEKLLHTHYVDRSNLNKN